MYHSSSTKNKTLVKSTVETSRIHSRERAFDPFNYEFDTGTMAEPFTYFHDGPSESRRKSIEYPSPTFAHLSYLSTHHHSILSSPEQSPQSHSSLVMSEQLKTPPNLRQQPQSQPSSYPKTICRHCKSHNMPECLYTSHSMYDESGAIFCPVLKKCHCATCMRVTTNPNHIRDDDDSDDEIQIPPPSISNEWSHSNGIHPRQNSSRMNNINNF